jgi:hypothetical protein
VKPAPHTKISFSSGKVPTPDIPILKAAKTEYAKVQQFVPRIFHSFGNPRLVSAAVTWSVAGGSASGTIRQLESAGSL